VGTLPYTALETIMQNRGHGDVWDKTVCCNKLCIAIINSYTELFVVNAKVGRLDFYLLLIL